MFHAAGWIKKYTFCAAKPETKHPNAPFTAPPTTPQSLLAILPCHTADRCVLLPKSSDVVQLACGDSHSLIVDGQGHVYCWGANSCGQVGISIKDPRTTNDTDGVSHVSVPVLLEALQDQVVVSVACGEAHSLCVTNRGDLYSWGACSCGQLGIGDQNDLPRDQEGYPYQPNPALVTVGFEGRSVLRVACGGVHNLAITESSSSLATSISSLLSSEYEGLADVAFRVQDQSLFYAHSCLLEARAPSIYDAIKQSLAEDGIEGMGPSGSNDLPVVERVFQHVRREVLEDLMYYIYTADLDAFLNTTTSCKFENVLELSHLCTNFGISSLLPSCRKLIRQHVTTNGTLPVNLAAPAPQPDLLTPNPVAGDRSAAQISSTPSNDSTGWGVFFLASGQALVLNAEDYRATLGRGTIIDLAEESNDQPPQPGVEDGSRGTPSPFGVDTKAVIPLNPSLLKLLDRPSGDVQLEADDGKVWAHKPILACRCGYFQTLFSSEFKDAHQKSLRLPDVQISQLRQLLEFVYGDAYPDDDVEYALEMLPLADRMQTLDLKKRCERTLIAELNVANVSQIFACADRFNCQRLRNRALMHMSEPDVFHTVSKTTEFCQLDKALILEIIQVIT